MSEHEHQMVSDHAIPPYAWHYKCAVEGCYYETDSFKIPTHDKDTEITRLQAELAGAQKELNSVALATSAVMPNLLRELDEARNKRDALQRRVEVLETAIEAWWREHPHIHSGPLAHGDTTESPSTCPACRLKAVVRGSGG